MATDNKLKELVINTMTKAQYDALGTKDPNEIYVATDEKIDAQDLDTSNVGTTGQVLSKTDTGMEWIDQGGSGSSYTAGTGISIADNNEISVAAPTLQNTATGTNSLTILGTPTGYEGSINIGASSSATQISSVAIGYSAQCANHSVAIGYQAVGDSYGLAIGASAKATGSSAFGSRTAIGNSAVSAADGAIQLSASADPTTNSDANTFKVANKNGNFEIMSANGNLPADRLASTTGLADGNYRLRLVMASGVPKLEWVAE